MQIPREVLAVLSASSVSGSQLVLPGTLDRGLYVQTNKVLEAAGGKWVRKQKAHVFDGEAESRIDQIILTGRVEIPRDEFNYFPTPPDLAAQLVRTSDVQAGMLALEPQAGRGAIASALFAAGAEVDCYELMPANAADLRAQGFRVTEVDFLTVPPQPAYDRVVMNPPFTKQADIKHTLHALGFLKPGGSLTSVMAAGVTFRSDRRSTEFRDLVARRGGRIEALPEKSFRASGTDVNTVVAYIPAA